MIEMLPTVWVSKSAELGHRIILGRNIRIFGPAQICSDVLIEDGVTIGHPSPSEMAVARATILAAGQDRYHDLRLIDDARIQRTVIGANSTIRSGSVIYSGVATGTHFDCAHNVNVRENCTFGDNCYLKVGAEIRRSVSVGVNGTLAGTVADRTTIADDVASHGHLMHKSRGAARGEIETGPTLENGAFVGRRACVIGAIRLGAGCYVAGGAVVTRDVLPGALVVGPPSREIADASPNRGA